MKKSYVALLLLFAVVAGCSGSEDNEPVDLTGRWYLKDSSVAAWPGFPVNICVKLNRPVVFTWYASDRMWIGQEEEGGTMYCVNDGVPTDTVALTGPYLQYWGSAGSAVGDSVKFNGGPELLFVGTIKSSELMNGARAATADDGRAGTWIMSRNPLRR